MISFIKGNSVDLEIFITLDGTPYDITGHYIWLTIKSDKSQSDLDAYLQVTSDDNISIENGPAGQILVSLSAAQTESIPVSAGTWKYDVQVRTPEGKVYTVLIDDVKINDRVTRAL